MPMEREADRVDPADAAFPRVMEVVQRWAGDGLRALLLSGSHAAGEAVWADVGGRRVSLSDLDLYLVLDSAASRAAAVTRREAGAAALRELGREEGIEAPIEVACLTEETLARLPARPGTIQLARHGRAVAGDPSVRDRVPGFGPGDVTREERLLLLENRAFELLLARPGVTPSGALPALQARHALHKVALDLAAVAALERQELPDGACARVEWARRRRPSPSAAWGEGAPAFGADLDRVWDEALAWRERGARPPAHDAEGAWLAVARAWCALWLAVERGGETGATADPGVALDRAARRAPLRRRFRLAIRPEPPRRDGLAHRLRHAMSGTPQHRVNVAAAALLMAAVRPGAGVAGADLDPGIARRLGRLGVPAAGTWAETARAVARAWDSWVLGGGRLAS